MGSVTVTFIKSAVCYLAPRLLANHRRPFLLIAWIVLLAVLLMSELSRSGELIYFHLIGKDQIIYEDSPHVLGLPWLRFTR